ncbi:hypothetical protein O181_065852 [Austropuccinia psidii MF-1]|uniref:Uncharacterized protein n=1 Tax=Austropuccinia psidii MF-1 TaxID=1389203 RepID=A0A9Q3I3P5_9BASI|nr:hypothetical protein [Austropuccinia psidii MF-1]
MMKAIPSGNGNWDPKQADRSVSLQLAWCPQVLICPSPLLGHHPMVTSVLDQRKVIIGQMKDGNGGRTFALALIITMCCHPWDSNAKLSLSSLTHFSSCNHTDSFSLCIEHNPLNSPREDSPVPHMPFKKTPWQPTPGLSGTQWSEDLLRATYSRPKSSLRFSTATT